ncbi:hypothetical protein MSG28_000300 [Choristoneura fumiferana]|uniref:Uncharacterized protein n=1 Tax=Choristoneura fumiferana TaxID=7141 RepID=A0ACC0K0D8_CHOFU|nr:hypothetical protein MSG28_000300 [Choristoneura fumiferana]
MIHSLFIINPSGDVFLEKHWRSVIPRSVCDYYLEAQRASPNDVPPVLAAPHHYLISIQRGGVALVAVCKQEVAPLFVIEFLHRVVDTFQLLDEMLDNGFPLATESNILKELIKPPNILRTIANTVTGKSNVSSILPSGQLSNVPWRRSGVKYANNEAYFDVVEEVDAIIDKSGATVSAEIQGYSERILSFIPPDGNFRLMSYHIGSQSVVAIPIYVRHNLVLRANGDHGRLDLTVGPKQTMGRTLENVAIEICMPKCVLNCSLTANQGKYSYDPVSKVLLWDIGRIELPKLPNIRGSVSVASGADTAGANPSINVHFTIPQLAVSGLRVSRLDMYGAKYKPFKGVKYVTKAGKFHVRM